MKAQNKLRIQLIFLFFTIVFIVMAPLRMFILGGQSMAPTYQSNQAVFAIRYFNLHRGDVAIICDPYSEKNVIIKRIVATEGDAYWQYDWHDTDGKARQYYLFGLDLDKQIENFANTREINMGVVTRQQVQEFMKSHTGKLGSLTRCVLKPNFVFVLGDNPSNSIDSRDFGPIPIDSVLYKVM